MPVLPAVPSTTVPPGFSVPRLSASRMMNSAARSFTEPPGLRNSALPRISQPVSSESLRNRTSGVLPTVPAKPSVMLIEDLSFERPTIHGVGAREIAGAHEDLESLGDLPREAQRPLGIGEPVLVDHVDVLRKAPADADHFARGGSAG